MNERRVKIVPAVYLVLLKKNKALLSRRFQTGYEDGKWSLIAGHLNGKETLRQAMIREAKEEADIVVKEKDLRVAHLMHRFEKKDPVSLRERIDVFFACPQWTGKIKNMEPKKCDSLAWFNINNLPKNTIPCVKQALGCVKKKIFYSEFGWDKKR